MNKPTIIVHFNYKTHLFIMELNNGDTKSLIPVPRWVQNKSTLEIWLKDRINDNTFPKEVEIIYE